MVSLRVRGLGREGGDGDGEGWERGRGKGRGQCLVTEVGGMFMVTTSRSCTAIRHHDCRWCQTSFINFLITRGKLWPLLQAITEYLRMLTMKLYTQQRNSTNNLKNTILSTSIVNFVKSYSHFYSSYKNWCRRVDFPDKKKVPRHVWVIPFLFRGTS